MTKKPIKDRMKLPYNLNSTMKFASMLIASHKGVSYAVDDVLKKVKKYCADRRLVDTHIMTRTNLVIPYEMDAFKGAVELRLAKAIHVNYAILYDVLKHFKCPYIENIDIDLDIATKNTVYHTLNRMFKEYKPNYNALPKYEYLDESKIDSLLYVSEYVGMSLRHYLSDDDEENLIQYFPFNTYGGKKLSEYKNVYNKAFCKLVIPDEISKDLYSAWKYDIEATKKNIRDIMEPYFYKEEIAEFIKTMTMCVKRSEYEPDNTGLKKFNDYIYNYYRDFSFGI